jgi:hypothetical protein
MVLAFLFPAELVFEFARPEEAKNPSGGIVLHLIQMRLAALSFEKSRGVVKQKTATPSPIPAPQTQSTFHLMHVFARPKVQPRFLR